MKYTCPSCPSRPSAGAGGGVYDQPNASWMLSPGSRGCASGIHMTVPSTTYWPGAGGCRGDAVIGIAGLSPVCALIALPFTDTCDRRTPPGDRHRLPPRGTRREDVLPEVDGDHAQRVGGVVHVHHGLAAGHAIARHIQRHVDGVPRVLDPVVGAGIPRARAGAALYGARESRRFEHRAGHRASGGRRRCGIQRRRRAGLCRRPRRDAEHERRREQSRNADSIAPELVGHPSLPEVESAHGSLTH